ncbi:MAG: hypothetical protein JW827_03390 [Spirochaetes bacterium]|nr:hypothetical protein [Spirochaetota bacterium]
MKITNIIIILLFLFTLSACEEDYETKGFYIDDGRYYQVISYGRSADEVENKVKSRNMAKEAALIYAQKQVHEELGKDPKILNSGLILKTVFINDHLCQLTYQVRVKE